MFYYPYKNKPQSYLSGIMGTNVESEPINPSEFTEPTFTKISFGYDFNDSVENIPEHITHLEFEGNFDQILNFNPSNKLTHLKFGLSSNFNQPIDLTIHLTHLYFFGLIIQ